MSSSTFIEIIGGMGTGKTTLAKVFGQASGFHALLEREEDLKRIFFLQPFFDDRKKYGFEGALNFSAFTLNRVQEELFGLPTKTNVISDLSMLINYAYTEGTLNPAELHTMQDIIRHSYAKLPPVNLRVKIDIPSDLNLQRIKARGRAHEKNVQEDFLAAVQNNIGESLRLFGGSTPVLHLDAAKYDWANNEEDKKAVINLIKSRLPRP